ncbi:hypothetical protein ACTMTU_18470 [Streptomyces sp. OZ13]
MPTELHKQAKQPVSAGPADSDRHPAAPPEFTRPVGTWAGSALGSGE